MGNYWCGTIRYRSVPGGLLCYWVPFLHSSVLLLRKWYTRLPFISKPLHAFIWPPIEPRFQRVYPLRLPPSSPSRSSGRVYIYLVTIPFKTNIYNSVYQSVVSWPRPLRAITFEIIISQMKHVRYGKLTKPYFHYTIAANARRGRWSPSIGSSRGPYCLLLITPQPFTQRYHRDPGSWNRPFGFIEVVSSLSTNLVIAVQTVKANGSGAEHSSRWTNVNLFNQTAKVKECCFIR